MRKTKEHVSLPEAKRRALAFMKKHSDGLDHRLFAPSQIGCAIWPTATYRGQGAGLAGVRILKLMQKDGLVGYRWNGTRHGWYITSYGLHHLAEMEKKQVMKEEHGQPA